MKADRNSESMILHKLLTLAIILSIAIIIIGMLTLFITSDTYGVYATSICSVTALFNCIGLVLIKRRHKSGTILVILASLLSAIALSITCAGWLNYSFGIFGVYLPYIVVALYMTVLFMLLFHKTRGVSAWQQMDVSLDLAHFRHIYQLSTVILLAIIVSAYFVMPRTTETDLVEEDDVNVIDNVSKERLDRSDVTIEEVVSFERSYNESTSVEKRDSKVTNRIFALKHILLSGLMPDFHNRDNLVNICMVHAGDFSPEQQEILDWFMALDMEAQSEWNICEKANTILEFKENMLKQLNK